MTTNTGSYPKLLLRRGIVSLLAVVSVLGILHRPLSTRIADLLNPYSFNGDALQHIAPLWALHNPSLAAHDYIRTYYMQAILPTLFKWIYASITLCCTPIIASKIVTVALSVAFIALLVATSYRLCGGYAAYLTLLFSTADVLKNTYFLGGIQRGFGICLASCALYALCSGRVILVGIVGVLAASIYPAAAVFILCVSALILALPPTLRGSAASWSVKKRAGWLLGCVLASAVMVAPQLLAGVRYGERLSMDKEAEFQEWSSAGRYTQGDRGVPVGLFSRTFQVALSGLTASCVRQGRIKTNEDTDQEDLSIDLTPHARGIVAILVSVVCGVIMLIRTPWSISSAALRVALFPVGVALSFSAATVFFPLLYIPSRYIAVGIIPLIPVVFPCIWAACVARLCPKQSTTVQGLSTLLVGGLAFVALGWLTTSVRHLPSAAGHRPLFTFIRSLPQETVIASWPRGVINTIPLFTARTVLLFEEGHQVFHRDFTNEARARMHALIATYSATDEGPIEVLKNTYGVTHLLLDTRHLRKTPSYFEPFDTQISEAREAVGNNPLYLEKLAAQNAVFSHGPFILIDLKERLSSPSAAP